MFSRSKGWPTLIGLAAACAFTPAGAQEPLKIGFMYTNPIADVGWVAVHEEARKALEQEFAGRVTTHASSSIAAGPDGARNIQDFLNQGDKMIVLGSFGYMNDGLKAARQHPDVNFAHVSGYKQAANFSTYNARWYQGAYVAGQVAGKMTRSNQLGFVGSVPIPDVISTLNAFTLGARSVNPDITVNLAWTSEWYNPGKERDAAKVLIAQKSDIIFPGFLDSPAVIQVAEEKGVYVIGMFSDMKRYAPKYQLTSITHSWLPYLRAVTQASLDGKQYTGAYWGGIKDGAVKLTAWNDQVPAAVAEQAKHTEDAIVSGELSIFAGPLRDNEGKERVAAGTHLPDSQIASMDWLVEGINGSISK